MSMTLGFRLEATAYKLFTGAGRRVDPGIALPIFLGGPGTRRVRRLAVVLASLGQPVTLLGFKLGLGGGPALRLEHKRHRQNGRESGRHEKRGLLHTVTPSLGCSRILAHRETLPASPVHLTWPDALCHASPPDLLASARRDSVRCHGAPYPRKNVWASNLFPTHARNNCPGGAFFPVRLVALWESTGMTEMDQRREAFAALVQPHLPTLWRCIRRLVRETQDAEDLVQETCLKAFRALHHFQPGTHAKAWLLTILMNTYRDGVRATLRHPDTVSLDEVGTLW